MPDIFDRIAGAISESLPNQEDKELLEQVIDILREEGFKELKNSMKEMLERAADVVE
jgi:hypothetical protein